MTKTARLGDAGFEYRFLNSLRLIAAVVFIITYAFGSYSWAADSGEVKAIGKAILAHGYVHTLHAGGTARMTTILLPGKSIGMPKSNDAVEITVAQNEQSSSDAPLLLYIMVGETEMPITAVITNKTIQSGRDHLINLSRVKKVFTDGTLVSATMDGVLDQASDEDHDIDLKKEELRKRYQAEYDSLIQQLHRQLYRLLAVQR